MDFASLIHKNIVKVPLEGQDKDEVLAELVEIQVRAGAVKDRDGVLEALSDREAKGSTAIGNGVAIPHAKHRDVQGVAVGVGVSREGVSFDARDGRLVHLFFLVLAGCQDPSLSISVLAGIANLVQVPGLCEQMVSARDVAALIEVFQKVLV